MDLIIPKDYTPILDLFETQQAIKIVKDTFERVLASALNLERVTAPIILSADDGINDDLNGVERKVSFEIKNIDKTAEVVQSLAKWKRMALYRYDFHVAKGCIPICPPSAGMMMWIISTPSMWISGIGKRSF